MRRLGMIVLAAAAVAGLAAILAGRYGAPEPTYTVAQVAAGLRGQPAQWAGRTVLVRGVVSGGGSTSACASVGAAGGGGGSNATIFTGGAGAAGGPCASLSWVTIGPTGLAQWRLFSSIAIARSLPVAGGNLPGLRRPVAPRTPALPAHGRSSRRWGSIGGWVRRLVAPPLGWGPGIRILVRGGAAEQLVVSLRPGEHPPAARPARTLPDGLYTLPVVGPLVSKLFPRDGSQLYRVRLLDPRSCANTAPGPCPDAVFAS